MFVTRHCSVNKFLFLSDICVNLELRQRRQEDLMCL